MTDFKQFMTPLPFARGDAQRKAHRKALNSVEDAIVRFVNEQGSCNQAQILRMCKFDLNYNSPNNVPVLLQRLEQAGRLRVERAERPTPWRIMSNAYQETK